MESISEYDKKNNSKIYNIANLNFKIWNSMA